VGTHLSTHPFPTQQAPRTSSAAAALDSPPVAWDGLSLDFFPELKLAAAERLGETEEKVATSLLELRIALGKLPLEDQPAEMSDAHLLRFLRARKYRVEEAREVIKNAAVFEREHPQWFKDVRGEEFRALYESGFMRVLQRRDKGGRRVSVLLPTKMPGPELLNGDTMMRWNVWALGRMGKDPYFCVLGASVLETFDGFSFRQARAMSSNLPAGVMRKNFHYVQHCAAYRLGAIVVVKQPAYMSFMWALVRPFMSAKMRSRVFMLGNDLNKLHTDIMDPADLPPEFGGSSTEDAMAWYEEQLALEARGL
jgi:hypothetical protein